MDQAFVPDPVAIKLIEIYKRTKSKAEAGNIRAKKSALMMEALLRGRMTPDQEDKLYDVIIRDGTDA